MFNKKQDGQLVRLHSIKQIKSLGFEPDGFVAGLLDNGFDTLLDTESGTIFAFYQGQGAKK